MSCHLPPQRRCKIAFLAIAIVLLSATTACADSTSEYGEVTRFGGFDSSAYNSGHYGGALTAGKFLDPTGFAVDTQDNTVYVVDRTSFYAENPTSWRIQQFNSEGALLGSTTFTLPNSNFGATAIMGLAVDHSAKRLYALAVGSPPSSSPNKLVPVAQELLAWSTTAEKTHPQGEPELVAAEGLASDPLHTTGGLVSSEAQLLSGSRPLFAPQGIAIDRLETPGVDNPVAIEASDLLPGGQGNPIRGNTVVQQIATQSHGTTSIGDLLSSWSGVTVAATLGASWGPLGISSDPDGSLSVLLDASNLSATDVYVVKLKADLSDPVVLNSDALQPPIGALDQASLWLDESPFFTVAGVGVSTTSGAGAEVARLSTAASNDVNGLYAGDFFSTRPVDYQFSPTSPGPEYWLLEKRSGNLEANIGIRLLEPGAGEVISDPIGGRIVNTLGNGTTGGPCNIAAPEAALAAGAKGTLWVLDRGPQANTPGANGLGRQIIELAPGAESRCPQPSGTFTMTPEGEATQPGEGTLTVHAGTKVTFDAQSINREHGKPFTYEWDLDGDPTNGPLHDGFETIRQMQPPEYFWPPSDVTYTYAQPGKYEVRARLHSDYGVYTTPPVTIIVTSTAHPLARFTATVTPGSQQVLFNTTGSIAGVGSIANYHWNWGDGNSEDEGPDGIVLTHTYAQPGVYTVTLAVTNSSYQSTRSSPQTITVQAPPPPPVELVGLTGPLYNIPPVLYAIPPAPDRSSTHLSPQLHFANRTVSVKLSCPMTKRSCAGTVRLQTVATFSAGRGRGKAKRRARLLLGQASFTMSGGAHKTVMVRLSASGMALLKKSKRLGVLVTVSAHDSLGDPGVSTLRFTLKAPIAKHSRRQSRH